MTDPNWLAPFRHFTSHSPEETLDFGRRLARALPRPALLVLSGDLGAGKTILAKGIAEGLGVARADDVASPSYTLVHEYRSAADTLYHLDLYRLEQNEQLATLGLEDILPGGVAQGSVVVVEWGAKFPLFARLPRIVVALTATGDATRAIAAAFEEGRE